MAGRPTLHHELDAATRRRRHGGLQARLRVGPVDDPLEREADRVAARIARTGIGHDPAPSYAGTGGEHVRRAVATPQPRAGEAPPAVEAVARTPGAPLADGLRHELEHRFGADLSRVRIHRDGAAARSAASVDARAYTIGRHVVFGAGEYAPGTDGGLRLLAHELAHVLQQDAGTRDVVRRVPDTPASDTAGSGGSRAGAPSTTACCDQLTAPASCRVDPLGCPVGDWMTLVMDCLRAVPVPSGVTHRTAILADAEREARLGVADARTTWQGLPRGRRSMRGFLDLLGAVCRARVTELGVEYRFDVVFENLAGQPQWGTQPAWDDVIAALEALPPEHLAPPTRRTPLRLRRRSLDPAAARPLRVGGRMVSPSEVEIYDPGVQRQPYRRSRALGLPGTSQTIRHEVGHTVHTRVSRAERDRFQEQVVGWVDYSWHWIHHRPTPTCDPQATGLQRQGCELCHELQFVSSGTCDDTRLDAFLAQVATSPRTRGGRRYHKSDHHLASVPQAAVPQTREFTYARTDFGEYFAEVYTFAVSAPEWLHGVLPRAQLDWLKQHVFDTATHVAAIGQVALREPYGSEFLRRSRRMFTRGQLDALLQDILARAARDATGRRAA